MVFDWLNIRRQERGLVSLFFLFAALRGVCVLAYKTASSTYFLQFFDASFFSYILFFEAAQIFLLGLFLDRLKTRVNDESLLKGIAWSTPVLFGIFYFAIQTFESRVAVFIFMGSYALIQTLFSLVFWQLAYNAFTVRQGKRVFAIIGSGFEVAAMLFGLVLPFLLAGMALSHLLLLAGVFAVGFAWLNQVLIRRYTITFEEGAQEDKENSKVLGLGTIMKIPLVFLVFLVMVFSLYTYNAMNFLFLENTQRFFVDEDHMAEFFALFYGVVSALVLGINLLFTGRLLSRFGMGTSLQSLPFTILVFSLGVAGGLIFWGGEIFWGVVLGFFMLTLVRLTLFSVANQLAIQPFMKEVKNALNLYIRSYFYPFASLISALVIFCLVRFFELGDVTLIGFLVLSCLAWIGITIRLKREYIAKIRERLTKRQLSSSEGEVSKDLLALFERGIESQNLEDVLYCYTQLKASDCDETQYLSTLWQFKAESARFEALKTTEQRQLQDQMDQVQATIQEESYSLSLRGQAMQTFSRLAPQRVSELFPYLKENNEALRREVMVALLKSEAFVGMLEAGLRLRQLAASSDPTQRLQAAEIIAEVPQKWFLNVAAAFIEDPDPRVRDKGYEAAAAMGEVGVIPTLVHELSKRRNHRRLRQLIERFGKSGVERLHVLLLEESLSYPVFKILVKAVVKWGENEDLKHLFFLMPNLSLRRVGYLLRCLVSKNFKIDEEGLPLVEGAIQDGFHHLIQQCRLEAHLSEEISARFARHGIRLVRDEVQDHLIKLLSIKYAEIHDGVLAKGLASQSEVLQSLAIEYLDTKIKDRQDRVILDILEYRKLPNKLYQKLKGIFPQKAPSWQGDLKELFHARKSLNLWTYASLLRYVGEQGDKAYLPEVIQALEDREWIIRQSAAKALQQLDPLEFQRHSERLKSDSNPHVRGLLDSHWNT